MSDARELLRRAAGLLAQTPQSLPAEALAAYVAALQARAGEFLAARQRHGSSLYLLDRQALIARAQEFRAAFAQEMENFQPFFAVKCNNHPLVAAALVQQGLGLDVSSGLELEMALATGCRRIVFSGPGKTPAEHALALAHADKVTLLLDSFGELKRLQELAAEQGREAAVGVRLTTDEKGLWRKFGIPLSRLGEFCAAAAAGPVRLAGLQFHTSWNLDPRAQSAFLARLGQTLAGLPAPQRAALRFLDIGGGFWPARGEWLQEAATPQGRLQAALGEAAPAPLAHYLCPAAPIGRFAQEIGAALRAHVFPHLDCAIYAEPGRWLANDAMHILLTVVDQKAPDLVITDGGTNLIGWERFENDYAPVINLSRPGPQEHPCYVLGSLCTPHDVWGYSFFGQGIAPGDVLLIPHQGAYTYSLRQHFIKPLAAVAPLSLTEKE
ncbi:MAG: decarboxylase [Desulfarculus sp.]|nr:MAG: decarboxylase [Desulfarculus sp.]